MALPQPNILLITTDQQRYDTIGAAAPAFLRTPHLDQLMRDGIEFQSAYAECPLCVPTRASIMTGKSVFTHGMMDNRERTLETIGYTETLPSCLKRQGYQTAAVGKMHFGPQRTKHGFDEMLLPDDYYREMRHSGAEQQPMRHGLGQNELYPTMATVPESRTLTNWIAQKSMEYILFRRDPALPFFLWCSFSKPHPPFDPPEPYYSMYRNCPVPEPVYGDWSADEGCPEAFKRSRQCRSYDLMSGDTIREARSAYYGLITQVDYNLGRVLAALHETGQADNTLIVFASDHGEYLGDFHAGHKVYFHEVSARVPLLISLPKRWDDRRAGTAVANPVTHADILPTLAAAAGGAAPDWSDGQDLIALARGRLDRPREFVEGACDYYGKRQYMAITDGASKYIWYPEGGAEQLFDLARDPHELRNLADSPGHRGLKERLHAELTRRYTGRDGQYVRDGRLAERPLEGDTEAERRSQPKPALVTEYCDLDIRQ